MRLIVSLFDFTGNWCKPYRDAGYEVEQIDLKLGHDVRHYTPSRRPWGVLAAPPCTIWTNAAAWMWPAVPPEEYELQKMLVIKAWSICRLAESFHALENPRGRLHTIIGPHAFEFQPYWYGDSHSKRTCLWGDFNLPAYKLSIPGAALVGGNHTRSYPLFGATVKANGLAPMPKKFSKMTIEEKETRRAFRSATPLGFAAAFFAANP